jgi:hypothetical protein
LSRPSDGAVVVANEIRATALVSRESGISVCRGVPYWRAGHRPARLASAALAFFSAAALLFGGFPAAGASNKVRITNLTDVSFGTIANLNVDAIQGQSVCVYADTNTNGYNVTGIGTGPGGAFELSSGAASMPFDVLWNSSAGQISGTQLMPNVPLTGQVSGATHQSCNNGPATTASLVVVLRSVALSSATAGTYNGTVTLLIGPE